MTDPAPPVEAPPKKSGALRFAILILLVIAGALVFKFTPAGEYVKPEVLRAKLESVRSYWWAGPLYTLIYGVGCVVGMPGTVVTLAGGLVFGRWWGMLWVILGSNLGVNLAFWTARTLGRSWLEEKLKGGRIDALNKSLETNGFLRVLQLRLIPAVPFNVLNFACGLSKVKWPAYAAASFLGMLPGTVAFVYFAGVLVQQADTPEAKKLKIISVCIAAALLVLVTAIPILYKKLRGKSDQQTS